MPGRLLAEKSGAFYPLMRNPGYSMNYLRDQNVLFFDREWLVLSLILELRH